MKDLKYVFQHGLTYENRLTVVAPNLDTAKERLPGLVVTPNEWLHVKQPQLKLKVLPQPTSAAELQNISLPTTSDIQ